METRTVSPPDYLTSEEIRIRLVQRRAGRKLADFHAEVERLSRMRISKCHLANILSGKKKPNPVVMAYLGGGTETSKVYWVNEPVKRKRR